MLHRVAEERRPQVVDAPGTDRRLLGDLVLKILEARDGPIEPPRGKQVGRDPTRWQLGDKLPGKAAEEDLVVLAAGVN